MENKEDKLKEEIIEEIVEKNINQNSKCLDISYSDCVRIGEDCFQAGKQEAEREQRIEVEELKQKLKEEIELPKLSEVKRKLNSQKEKS